MTRTKDLARRFAALHEDTFIIGNAWDAGSASLLAEVGFKALATSSAASAATLGLRDGEISQEAAIAHIRCVAQATNLPVSADLENGFGDAPEAAAQAVRLAADAGAVGGSIEDAPREPGAAPYPLAQAIERVQAAAEAARQLDIPFTFTARCENFLRGRSDFDDTVERLLAYERAGANVLFAPGLQTLVQVETVCKALRNPLNFMVGIPGRSFSVAELQQAGVRRISLATSLYSRAMKAARSAAMEVMEQGTFGYLEEH